MPTFAFSTETSAHFARATTFLGSTVCVLSGTSSKGESFGMTASSVTAVSVDPAMLLVCIKGSASILGDMKPGTALTVTVLRAGEADIAKRFGQTPTARENPPEALGGSNPLACFDCSASTLIPAGDHVIVLLDVSRVKTGVGEPLIYWRRGLYALATGHDFLASPTAFADFLAAWCQGTLARERWTHAAHVGVAAHYAFSLGGEELYRTMRDGIMHFNRCIGGENTDTSGYHETLTRFWSETVRRFVASGGFASSYDAAVAAVGEFGNDRDLFRMYYDFDVVSDRTARRTWIPPREP